MITKNCINGAVKNIIINNAYLLLKCIYLLLYSALILNLEFFLNLKVKTPLIKVLR